ncbi:MAG: cytochrome b [Methylophilaceae bacterium]|nr:cytochrome b [Methylophilaceae bacterium]
MTTQKYSKPAIILHGLTAVIIFIMFALGWYMADLPRDAPKVTALDLFDLGLYTLQFDEAMSPRSFYFNLHKSIGVTLLLLILIRVYVRLTHQPPAFPDSMKAWEKKIADLVHKGLYVLMVAMPLSGILMAINSKYGIMWFGLPLAPGLDNPELREAFKEVHEIIGAILISLIALHVAAAIKHKVIDKDEIMSRMSLR